ncbi:hypothetical protein B0H11DRAFT_1715087, partial [Mycena galericulata]
ADFYNFALLDGRRITPTDRSRRNSAGSSLIQARYKKGAFCGEIRYIFRHSQVNVPNSKDVLLAFIEWMLISSKTPLDGNNFVWNDFPELGIDTYEYNKYADPGDQRYPPIVMPLDELHCQISRGKISHTEPPLWMTVSMDRVCDLAAP